ncbi:hypothetical protein CND04015 [Cryptococcus deneoformans JEC21]|uniref:Secreted protein n=1 Tax=Cryptococcus deneoformans (strain JEC21 / ATCC MYA-565) TaxID=214684 RepID=A0A0S2LIS3_CRYD1|nr:hypothetical protein CND04015 [Cryptococcus neoformans var. neoformans JEC21]ALO60537.1 hypothetical protein CND04015 [Cryptococcus neoformans var. neoformans JEC21]
MNSHQTQLLRRLHCILLHFTHWVYTQLCRNYKSDIQLLCVSLVYLGQASFRRTTGVNDEGMGICASTESSVYNGGPSQCTGAYGTMPDKMNECQKRVIMP